MLVVYNTCGLVRDNTQLYIRNLESLLNQDLKCDVVVSSCCNSEACAKEIVSKFPIYYNHITDKLPISVTFNHTVEIMTKLLGEFDDVMCVDSGIDFGYNSNLRKLYELHKSGPYAMTCARTTDDMGFDDWFHTSVFGEELFKKGHLIVPTGKAVNLHAQIFSREIRDTYGRVLPDIFAGQCMESVFSFMCAALKKRWIVHKDVVLDHLTGADGPSSGFNPAKHVNETGKPRWDHMFGTDEPVLDIMGRGVEYGMGYEENQGIVMHREDCYEDGLCTNDELKVFIRNNLFLKNFDYSSVKCEVFKNDNAR